MKVRVVRVGICGSDIQRLDMGQPIESLGHEIIGEHEGVFYAVNPLIVCGKCNDCDAGRTRFCKKLASLGKDGNGGFAGGILDVPDRNLVQIETGEGAYTLADPVACSIHALSFLNVRMSQSVLVVGDGTMALICAELLTQRGAVVTQVIKREPRRLRAHPDVRTILSESIGKDEYDSVVVCVGGTSADVLNRAANAVKATGSVVVVGAYHFLEDALDIKTFLKKEVTLKGSFSFEPPDFRRAIAVIDSNREFFGTVISSEFTSSELANAVLYHRTNDDRRKVVVSFD